MKICPTYLASALAVALLLPSCLQWNIGENIRESAERRIGIDPTALYHCGKGKDGVTVAREMSYKADTPLVNTIPLPAPAAAYDAKPTGYYREAELHYRKLDGMRATVGERYEVGGRKLERRASGPLCDDLSEFDTRSMGSVERVRGPWYPAAVVAAAPFDYVVDPALSVVTTPFLWVGCGAVIIYSYVFD